jgi:hypothetical protein
VQNASPWEPPSREGGAELYSVILGRRYLELRPSPLQAVLRRVGDELRTFLRGF